MQIMANIDDVAAYIIKQLKPSVTDPMKLQKLAYFAQGWYLALLDKPLFADDFEAWKYGPVARSLYEHHRQEKFLAEWPWGNAARLQPENRIVLNGVLNNYGMLGGWQLSKLTHRPGTPWDITRQKQDASPGQASHAVIEKPLIANYFKELLLNQGDGKKTEDIFDPILQSNIVAFFPPADGISLKYFIDYPLKLLIPEHQRGES